MYAGCDYIGVKKIGENSKNIFQLLQQREIGKLCHNHNFVYKKKFATKRITEKEYLKIQAERKRKYPYWKHL